MPYVAPYSARKHFHAPSAAHLTARFLPASQPRGLSVRSKLPLSPLQRFNSIDVEILSSPARLVKKKRKAPFLLPPVIARAAPPPVAIRPPSATGAVIPRPVRRLVVGIRLSPRERKRERTATSLALLAVTDLKSVPCNKRSTKPNPCHCEPVTDVTGVAIRTPRDRPKENGLPQSLRSFAMTNLKIYAMQV